VVIVKVGFASLDITPPLGSETPGGFTKICLWDIYDPLHIKAAVFENDGVKVALVSVDALSIKASTVKVAREIAEKKPVEFPQPISWLGLRIPTKVGQ